MCVLGPPLPRAFQMLLGADDAHLIERAVTAYRERFATIGMFENSLYPGVRDTLITLRASGHQMRVVTSKPRAYATRILAHFQIDRYFDAVHGPSLEDRTHNKTDLVAESLVAIGFTDAVMVGDRDQDIVAAKQNGIRSIAAAWGYGSSEELDRAGADYVVYAPYEIVERLASRASPDAPGT